MSENKTDNIAQKELKEGQAIYIKDGKVFSVLPNKTESKWEEYIILHKKLVWNDDMKELVFRIEKEAREEERGKIIQLITPTQEWKECLKVANGQDKICMMCGFNPEKLINLIKNK